MTTLTAFAETYPYLAGCFFAVLLFIACILLSKEQRRPMLLSSLLFTPFALTAIILVPSYWRPKLFWDLVVGVEDVIFCFFNGGIVWLGSVYFMKDRLLLPGKFRPLMTRYIKYILYGSIACSVLFLMGFGFLWSTLGVLYILGFMLLYTQRRLWPLALCGTGTFLAIYSLILKLMFSSWPHFIRQWNLPSLSGFIFGMPVEELVWALGFGFTWPLFMAHVFDVQVRPPAPTLFRSDSVFSRRTG
jgi:hypothetical protein